MSSEWSCCARPFGSGGRASLELAFRNNLGPRASPHGHGWRGSWSRGSFHVLAHRRHHCPQVRRVKNPPALSPDWRTWNADDWGRALLAHYFAGHDARPVSRLAISPEELARTAAAPESDARAARDAFLEALRCSPAAFRYRVSAASLGARAWNRRYPPPFAPYLFFTCYAAGTIEADAADQGVFRERVRQLLRHQPGTSYTFSDLSQLWEAFAEWLRERHDAGEPYRTLTLPDRGWMRLIGYSNRLAFPRREDRLRLRDTLAESGVGAGPTVPEAFRAISIVRHRFSADFRHVLDRARAALAANRDAPELEALWSAILEAAFQAPRQDRRSSRTRYQLLAQEDELGRPDLFVVSAGAPSGSHHGLRYVALDEPYEEFDHAVCAGDGTTFIVAKLLLLDALHERVPGLASSPVPKAIRDGVLLFRKLDSSTWVLTATRPTEGPVRALVRKGLSDQFAHLVPRALRRSRETRFDDWQEFPPFDAADLAEPQGNSGMASIRCLQRVEIGPQLHLVGGIRLDHGYLGLRGLLPAAHCANVDLVDVIRVGVDVAEDRSAPIQLAELPDQAGTFGWSSTSDDLEGPFLFRAIRHGSVIAPREVLFHSRGLRHDYQSPTDPSRWFVESGSSDVAPAGDACDVFLSADFESRPAIAFVEDLSSETIPVLTNQSADNDADHDRIIEALAAVAVARKGVAEAELIEIIRKSASADVGLGIWGMIRGWTEAGYLDCLSRRHWRGRVYFARRPRLVVVPAANNRSPRVVLHGLAAFRLRATLRDSFASAGARELSAASLSRLVPAPPAWEFDSLAQATEAIDAFGELEYTGAREPRELTGDFDDIVRDDSPLPPGYERERSWDWARCRFSRRIADQTQNGPRVDKMIRTNGPDRYLITMGDRRRTTLSRSWALLAAYRWSDRKAFAGAGTRTFVREGDDGPYVPLPVARAIALRAGIVAGPTASSAGGACYAYAAESRGAQRWALSWLSGSVIDDSVARRFAWLASATSRRRFEGVPIPGDLRRRLHALRSLPDATALAERRIPPHLVPYVRRAVDLAEA